MSAGERSNCIAKFQGDVNKCEECLQEQENRKQANCEELQSLSLERQELRTKLDQSCSRYEQALFSAEARAQQESEVLFFVFPNRAIIIHICIFC